MPNTDRTYTNLTGRVDKIGPLVTEEGITLSNQVDNQKVNIRIIIHIGRCHSHACLRDTAGVHGTTPLETLFFKP